MICPRCDTEMSKLPFEADLLLDRCDCCKGMWMDKGEFARFANMPFDLPGLSYASGTPTTDNCPACAEKDIKRPLFLANYQNLINLELCQGCEGLWFDHKEIATIREYLKHARINVKREKLGKK